ncbi:hypothetical protein [Acidocella facilis]|uniref:hypothetical protein n=1 Tax=Acidocella facilis TaxID=525 RepID=UPI001F2ECD1B|nr:hypothetical protein [Acidocella facilis]
MTHSYKIGYLGSCLSSIPIAALVDNYGFEECFRIHHNRSDAFRHYHCERSRNMLNRDWLDSFLVPNDDENTARDAEEFLDNQMLPHIGFEGTLRDRRGKGQTLFDVLQNSELDVILLDNFMDIAAKLMVKKNDQEFGSSPLFLNPHFYKNHDEVVNAFEFTEYLTPQDSASNWKVIYDWFRSLQPKAKIIFLCFPYATSRDTMERFNRARDFYIEFEQVMRGRDIEIIPPLDVEECLTNGPSDWYHVKPSLYQSLAGYIFLRTVAKFPKMGSPYLLE